MTGNAAVAQTGAVGGGIFSGRIPRFTNTIVAGNTVGPAAGNCSFSVSTTSNGGNLEGGSDCNFTATTDRRNANPMLLPLANNGGQTDTHALTSASPARDAGVASGCPPTDQRGVPRPFGSACDIGAYEFQDLAPPATTVISGPRGSTTDRTPTFTFSSTEPRSSFQCRLDGSAFVPCTSPLTLPELSPGPHRLEVRAVDAFGNPDPTPAVVDFSIALPPPVLGGQVNAFPVSGSVFVSLPAGAARAAQSVPGLKGRRFIPLRQARQVPVGSILDTRKGRVRLQSARNRSGATQSGEFSQGVFQVLQSGKRSARGLTELRMKASSFCSCRRKRSARRSEAQSSQRRRSRRRIRRLRGNAKGRFRTRGRYSAATVRGTIWSVTDRCDGTLTSVRSGRVTVRDFRKRKNVTLRRGKSYLAKDALVAQVIRLGRAALAAAAMTLAVLPAAAAAQYAPVDRPGPMLSIPRDRLAGALACSRGLDGAARTPVLLVHGTGGTREENWGASYQPALSSFGIPWCAVQLPQRAMADIQASAEHVVHAIREMRRRAGRRIAIIGASQGGALPRWAMRFWPDTRAMVDDLVALAPTNHGTRQARLVCRAECQPAQWQQMDGSEYIRALNSFQETFPGVSYTNVYTRFDEVVQPPQSAELQGGGGRITNVAIQDICPLDLSEHLALSVLNAVGFALAMDALAVDGPAGANRVAARGCAQPRIPGVRVEAFPGIIVSFMRGQGSAQEVPVEPPLRCYVTASCPPQAGRRPRLRVTVSPRRAVSGRVARLGVRVRVRRGERLRAVRGATVRAAGRRARTDRRGRAALRVRFVRPGPRMVTARRRGLREGRAIVRVLER